MATKTCIQQKQATYDLKNKMYPQRPQGKCIFGDMDTFLTAMKMKVNQHQMV